MPGKPRLSQLLLSKALPDIAVNRRSLPRITIALATSSFLVTA